MTTRNPFHSLDLQTPESRALRALARIRRATYYGKVRSLKRAKDPARVRAQADALWAVAAELEADAKRYELNPEAVAFSG